MPLPRRALTPRRGIVAGLAVTAIAAGSTLLAVELTPPAEKAVWASAVPVAVVTPEAAPPPAAPPPADPSLPDKSVTAVEPVAARKDRTEPAPTKFVDGVRLAKYDPARGTAVLATRDTRASVRTGDVIASPPTATAPKGALFEVGKVTRNRNGDVQVTTEPATLSDALGATEVQRKFPAKDLTMSITPLVAGVRLTGGAPAAAPAAAPPAAPGAPIVDPVRAADGGLLLNLDIPLDQVPGITGTPQGGPKLSGWVGLTPELIFSYGRKESDGAKPYQAEIGVGGKYTYGWALHAGVTGRTDTGEQALRLPFAEVHLSQTFWVGPVPVVLSTDLTYFYRVTTHGTLTIDAEQTTTGDFAVGAQYDSRTGWKPLGRNTATSTGNAVPVVTGQGDMRATIGADAQVFLYNAAGVTGRLAPYLRAAADTDARSVRRAVYGGLDVTSTLSLTLKILGVTLLDADLPLPAVHQEWRIAGNADIPAAANS